jgi:crotonobetainyl-CoA:carnitine CoA-transferase CaiB-like acyl-CoA transferase
MSNPTGPLTGYVVLDLTQILAGPFCTQMLADAGATVIKVEPPGGEFSRRRGPQRSIESGQIVSSFFAAMNRGKRSICLDLKNPDGVRIAKELSAKADVVIENFRPGVLDRLGLGLAAMRAERPQLITCSISLFGSVDVARNLAERGGLASVAEAESSLSYSQRRQDGTPSTFGFPLGDMGSGMAAYGGIVTALLARERTGVGAHIDIAMVKVLLTLNAVAIAREEIEPSSGEELPEHQTAAYGLFPAADGFVAIGTGSNNLFARLAKAMDMEWMAEDARYARHAERDLNADDVDARIAEWTSLQSKAEIVRIISSFGVPCGIVATPKDILDSADIANLGYLESVNDGLGGTIRTPANAFGFRRNDAAIPRCNEHGSVVLDEQLGMSSADYRELASKGAFGPV